MKQVGGGVPSPHHLKDKMNKNLLRVGIVAIDDVLSCVILKTRLAVRREYLGKQVKMHSLRYHTFLNSGTSCVRCKLKASYFALEQHPDNYERGSDSWHFNLYGKNADGHETLFTKDHIKPKSKGGKDIISNLQTMCWPCNSKKSNKWDENESTRA